MFFSSVSEQRSGRKSITRNVVTLQKNKDLNVNVLPTDVIEMTNPLGKEHN